MRPKEGTLRDHKVREARAKIHAGTADNMDFKLDVVVDKLLDHFNEDEKPATNEQAA